MVRRFSLKSVEPDEVEHRTSAGVTRRRLRFHIFRRYAPFRLCLRRSGGSAFRLYLRCSGGKARFVCASGAQGEARFVCASGAQGEACFVCTSGAQGEARFVCTSGAQGELPPHPPRFARHLPLVGEGFGSSPLSHLRGKQIHPASETAPQKNPPYPAGPDMGDSVRRPTICQAAGTMCIYFSTRTGSSARLTRGTIGSGFRCARTGSPNLTPAR